MLETLPQYYTPRKPDARSVGPFRGQVFELGHGNLSSAAAHHLWTLHDQTHLNEDSFNDIKAETQRFGANCIALFPDRSVLIGQGTKTQVLWRPFALTLPDELHGMHRTSLNDSLRRSLRLTSLSDVRGPGHLMRSWEEHLPKALQLWLDTLPQDVVGPCAKFGTNSEQQKTWFQDLMINLSGLIEESDEIVVQIANATPRIDGWKGQSFSCYSPTRTWTPQFKTLLEQVRTHPKWREEMSTPFFQDIGTARTFGQQYDTKFTISGATGHARLQRLSALTQMLPGLDLTSLQVLKANV